MDAPATPKPGRRHEVLVLWVAVALFPLLAALVMGAVHAGYGCTIPDDTAVKLFLVDFLGLPAGAAILGYLAGLETWRPRGRGWAGVGAFAVAFLSLVWGSVAFWTILITFADAACN